MVDAAKVIVAAVVSCMVKRRPDGPEMAVIVAKVNEIEARRRDISTLLEQLL
jgi:hypothetical protein